MKRIFLPILLFIIMIGYNVSAQVNVELKSIPPGKGKIIYFATPAMTDSASSTGYYSSIYNTYGFLAQNMYNFPINSTVVGTGTADSVAVILEGRRVIPVTSGYTPTYTSWAAVDTIIGSFNKVDGLPYFYTGVNGNLNGAVPDQLRIHVRGLSAVNRSDVVIKVWLNLFDQTVSNH